MTERPPFLIHREEFRSIPVITWRCDICHGANIVVDSLGNLEYQLPASVKCDHCNREFEVKHENR
jgi:hypothetical protein